ncbi:MAG: transporter [Clostridia bacterium]|jgi:putative tricarboxylic transport membrane protein|nr:transporter [Clostridia bacterium]
MKMKKMMSLVISVLIGASAATGCASKALQTSETAVKGAEEAKPAFTPGKEVEVVVPSSAGGGSDLNARTIADIAFKNQYTPKNFMVTNMPGGSGGVAFSYVYGKGTNDETIMVLHNGQIMSTIANNAPVTSDKLTYLPVVAYDNLLLVTKKGAPYQTVEDFIEAAKTPEKVKVGGSQRGNTDNLAFELINKYAETKAAYVQFNSSGDTMTALLGGHVDVGIFNPSECIGQIEAGELVPLATFAPEKIGGAFAEVPTFKEKGFDNIVLSEVRAFAGPPKMSAEAIAFYDEVLKKVTETDEWKTNYLEKNNLQPVYMNSAEAKAFFEKEVESYRTIFKEVGIIQ